MLNIDYTSQPVIVFAPSMATMAKALHLFPLHLIQAMGEEGGSMELFCLKAGIPYVKLKKLTDFSGSGLKGYRHYLDGFTDAISGQYIFFSARHYFKYEGYMLNRFRRKNILIFDNVDPYLPEINYSISLFFKNWSYKKVILSKLVYFRYFFQSYTIFREDEYEYALGWTADKCKSLSAPCPPMSSGLFQQNQLQILEKYNIGHCTVLFIDNVSKNVEPELMKKLTEIIKLYSPSTWIKPHYADSFRPSPSLTDAFPSLSREFPVELLQGIPSLVIGFYSTALLHFAESCPVISLSAFEQPTMPETKSYFMELMKKKSTIYFPDSPESLREILQKLITSPSIS